MTSRVPYTCNNEQIKKKTNMDKINFVRPDALSEEIKQGGLINIVAPIIPVVDSKADMVKKQNSEISLSVLNSVNFLG